MAFAVICKSCQARFLLNDDLLRRKVAGRVVTVRCRQCHAPIEVDASEVDPQTLPEPVKTVPAKATSKTLKPAPAPPRPAAKSTLMGIGTPTRAVPTAELTALSPGFLDIGTGPQADLGQHGFPEPPPPPGAIEELTSGDWEVAEAPPPATSDAELESLDDFAEELPPSIPPPEEEAPSSTGTPSLLELTHHDEHEPPTKPRADDFLASMSASGGVTASNAAGAPTIDVSAFSTAPNDNANANANANAPSGDISLLDVPLEGKQTLPLFALTGNDAPAPRAKSRRTEPRPPTPHGQREGSLSPAAVDRPVRDSEGAESVRERKNVVAPATKSVPPTAQGQHRSGLAAPVLLALAVAAGFLIWRRDTTHQSPEHDTPMAQAPAAAEPVPGPTPAAQPAAPEPTLAPSAEAQAPAADDITFEATPTKPAAPAAAREQAKAQATPAAVTEKAVPSSTDAKPEPTAPVAKEEPQVPTTPGEPAGPFDREAAAAALNSGAAQASACRKDGDPSGVASVVITFAPSGRVTSANISGPPFAGTPTGGCIAAALRKARVPAFEGDRVTVSKTVVIQ